METKKIIQINPALLKVSNKTRRRSPAGSGVTSSERSERSKQTSANLVKKQILNKIRQNYKGGATGDSDSDIEGDIPIHTDNDEFENSVKYFENLKKSMKPSSAPVHLPPVLSPQMPPQLQLPMQPQPQLPMQPQPQLPMQPQPQLPMKPQPQYGCLKGGSLPTYRNWQKTQKNPSYYSSSAYIDAVNHPSQGGGGTYYHPPSFTAVAPVQIQSVNDDKKHPSDWQKEKERIHQIMDMRRTIENSAEVARNAAPTRKRKITRRTYHVGKSKIHPKVSVLLSNKTIRSQIMTEKQHYNEIPIQDVKQYLQKKGLIKIGSNSPAHVLRSMYESAMLLGGDIVNHNKDTLLHNFLKETAH